MSQWSSVCDLADHIMMEKMYDKGSYKVSDELECFKIFKKKTGGKIYQHREITVSEWNQEYVKSKSEGFFDFILHEEEVEDKRCKEGKKINKFYTYKYWDKEYSSLKELNKHGVFITEEIKFETLLDIIPYYPYTVSMCCSDAEKETVYISTEPSYMSEYKRSLRDGGTMSFPAREIQDLARHYEEVVRTYYDYKLEERTKRISLIGYKPLHNGYYEVLLPTLADELHGVKFVWTDDKNHSHWTSPKLDDPITVLVSEQDIDYYLDKDIKNNTVFIEYVEACELPNTAKEN